MLHDPRTEKISVRLPLWMVKNLELYCDQYGMRMSQLIRKIIEDWLNRAH